jgi:glycosyltransferase involved in cell wall biosynthesis
MSHLACVIPFYSGSSTLGRALDSVFRTPICDEVILVSDFSPEPIRSAISDRYAACERSGRLRIVEMGVNMGQAAARNLGASLCLSPFLCFLDQDDEVLPEFYSSALQVLNDHPHLAAVEVTASIEREGEILLSPDDVRHRMIMDSVPWNIIVRRPAFWLTGGFPTDGVFRTEAAGEDIAFKTALKACFNVAMLPMVGVRHHVRHGSATDRFLRRTSVGANGEVVFHSRYSAECDGSLSAALGQHVGRAVLNRAALAHLLDLNR